VLLITFEKIMLLKFGIPVGMSYFSSVMLVKELKTEIMKNAGLKKGMIVKYKGGWGRLTRVTKNTVNIGGIWGQGRLQKGVPITEVFEDEANWYKAWTKTETYRCM
jgi:hypothetical protein